MSPAGLADGKIIFDAWGRYAENFERLTAPVFVDVADADRYLTRVFANPHSAAFHILEHDGHVVGFIKAVRDGHRAQIGYVVHRPYCGRGFATSAVREVTTIMEGVSDVARVWATCALDNAASLRVLEKCGFEREGILRSWVIYPALGGAACDNFSYVRP